MPQGFLAVSSQPSSQLSLEEFHAWYEEEHIPIRLNNLKTFLSGARYRAIDLEDSNEAQPKWLAMYEIDDTRTFQDQSYTGLRENRSERESEVMKRLEVLVRRTGEDAGVWGEEEGERSTGLRVGRPSGWVVTHGVKIGVTDDVVKEWAGKLRLDVKNIQGWVRVRVVKVLESGKIKMGAAVELNEEEATMGYFVVHEFDDGKSAASGVFKEIAVSGKEIGVEVTEWRVWELYKVYPSLAQGNVANYYY